MVGKGTTPYIVHDVLLVKVCAMFSEGVFKGAKKQWVVSCLAQNAGRYFMNKELEKVVSTLKIPKKLTPYFTRVGADRSKLTKEDLELISNRPEVINGALYGHRFYPHTGGNAALYRDQRFLQDSYFPFDRKHVATDTHDCLVHAVNFAFRYPIYLDRAQVVRLM